jgi:hypothetical protein
MAAKKKKTATKTYGNKTKFVLGLPRDMSAKQVVDEAKKQGITITEAHVYKIRSTAKAKGPKGAGAKGAASKGSSKASASGSLSKRDFVLSFGPDTKRGRRAAGAPVKSGAARARGGFASHEAAFIESAIDMGLSKAADLLDRLRARLKDL